MQPLSGAPFEGLCLYGLARFGPRRWLPGWTGNPIFGSGVRKKARPYAWPSPGLVASRVGGWVPGFRRNGERDCTNNREPRTVHANTQLAIGAASPAGPGQLPGESGERQGTNNRDPNAILVIYRVRAQKLRSRLGFGHPLYFWPWIFPTVRKWNRLKISL